MDGIVVTGSALSFLPPDAYDRIVAHCLTMKAVSINAKLPGGVPMIDSDSHAAIRDLVLHLGGHGRKRIAFITGPDGFPESRERFDGYREALSILGYPYDEALVGHGRYTSLSGATALEGIMSAAKDIDAVVASNDDMALGAMTWALERGYRVPEDIAFAGFDDIDAARASKPALASADASIGKQGRAAVDALFGLIAGKQVSDRRLRCAIAPRESCGCKPKGRAPRRQMSADEQTLLGLLETSQFFSSLTDLPAVLRAMEFYFPIAGFRTALLYLIPGIEEGAAGGRPRLRAGIARGKPIDRKLLGFMPGPEGLLPPELELSDEGREHLAVCPLRIMGKSFGVLVAGLSEETAVALDALRYQILGALNNCMILRAHLKAEESLTRANSLLEASNAQLTRIDSVKNQFISGISQELKTPLSLIIGPLESMKAGEYAPGSADERRAIELMLRNAYRLHRDLSKVLDYSRIQAGRQSLELGPVNLSESLSLWVKGLESSAAKKGIRVSFSDEAGGLVARVDHGLLQKAFFNLMSNAFKFTAQGGSIVAALRRREGGMAVIEVRDTGIGIPPSHLEGIFDGFVAGGSSRGGSGIGLSLTREIAELHGGSVEAESRVNEGSAFRILIPVGGEYSGPERLPAESPEPSLAAEFEPAEECGFDHDPAGAKFSTILVVDGNADMRDYLAWIVSGRHRALKAASGKEALATIAREEPDLVLSDAILPDMDGSELVGLARATEAGRYLPVILLCSAIDEARGAEGQGREASEYVAKPFAPHELLARIDAHVQMKLLRDKLAMKNEVLEEVVRQQIQTIESEKNQAVALQKKAQKQLEEFLMVLASAIESKDHYTGGHVERVARYSRDLAKAVGLSEREVQDIYLGAIVHDIGKLGIKDSILNKKGELDAEEREQIKMHTVLGLKILSRIEDIDTAPIIAYCHQERWDGKGYPRGLKGEDIPLCARIVAIADVWDSLVTDRPYRRGISVREAVEKMRAERGTAFDPLLLDHFLDPSNAIYERYVPRDRPE
jgi:response regulator RpfG family c-di-GMP phosphodiesterase/signal transduction histidine kinase